MKKIWKKVHFDKNRQLKSLIINYNLPEIDNYNNVKEGSIVLSIVSKENSQGFQLSTGDVADFIEILTLIRKSLINKGVKLQEKEE